MLFEIFLILLIYMKRLISFLFILLLLAGCSARNSNTRLEYHGISFEYPKDSMTVSFDEFDPFEGENIYVNVSSISDFVKDCVEADLIRNEDALEYETKEYYSGLLKRLGEKGLSEGISNFDNLSCGWTRGNISARPIVIDGIKGVVYNKALTQIEGSLTVFFTQVVLVDEYDRVYSIVFNYDFGELADYLAPIKSEFGEAILDERDFDKYYEVYNHFAFDNPIKTSELMGFLDNREVIGDIIDSIEISIK